MWWRGRLAGLAAIYVLTDCEKKKDECKPRMLKKTSLMNLAPIAPLLSNTLLSRHPKSPALSASSSKPASFNNKDRGGR